MDDKDRTAERETKQTSRNGRHGWTGAFVVGMLALVSLWVRETLENAGTNGKARMKANTAYASHPRRQHGRPCVARPVEGDPDPPLVEFLSSYWIWLLFLVILVWISIAGHLNGKYLQTDALGCMREAVAWWSGSLSTCALNLQNAVANGIAATSSAPSLFKGGMPRALIWADNLFVDLYTLFFIASSCAAYKWLTTVKSDPIVLWRAGISVTCALSLLGGIADHAKNFWLLAYMDPDPLTNPGVSAHELAWVARISAWTFQLFLINSVVALLWWALALFRTRWALRRYRRMREVIDATRRVQDLPGTLKVHASAFPDEASFRQLMIIEPRSQVSLAVFVYYFFAALKTEPRFTYSFSRHAVERWVVHVCPDDAHRHKLPQGLREEVAWFLDMLSVNGFLARQGTRYRVTWSNFGDSVVGTVAPDDTARGPAG